MRLQSFLPILLLVAGSLSAQNCQIFDLTASIVQSSPSSACEFFVVLDFEHSGTTNQFTVSGNGHNYGTFTYTEVPVMIGPLTASLTGPSDFEFIVHDAVFADCFDETILTVPSCGTVNCDISDLIVNVGDCNPGTGTYNLTVNFQASGSNSNFFELFANNSVSLGVFPIDTLPLTIHNFPWTGPGNDLLKVCINDQPNCCESIEFAAPNCTPGCGIVDLLVTPGDCLSDSTYKLNVDFHLLSNISLPDSFHVYLDDSLHGQFALTQLPLPLIFETSGHTTALVRVCIDLPLGVVCCLEKQFEIPVCLPPCTIQNLSVETDSICTSDSTFGIWVNFQVADSTAVDTFALWANGEALGHFGMDQLPLHLDSFLWNGLIFNNIKVCTGNETGCCKEFQFLAPACLPFDTCEVTDIFVHADTTCHSDSTYKVLLNFNATNPGDGTFIVWTNGVLLDTFDLSEAPITIPNFHWSGGIKDTITVCIGTSHDTSAVSCCKTQEFAAPACFSNCEISNLQVLVGDCDSSGHAYSVKIDFEVNNPGNDLFEVWANGQLLGTYPLSQLPLTIPNFPASGNPLDLLKVCINDQANCCVTKEIHAPVCGDCSIFDLHVVTGDCNPDGTYNVTLNFGVSATVATEFTVYGNGVNLGVYHLIDLPLNIPNFPWDGSGPNDVLKVCMQGIVITTPCCETIEFPTPHCVTDTSSCDINGLNVQTGDCSSDSTYHLTVNFQVANPPGNTFGVWANGEFFGTYELSQLPLTIDNFPWNGGNHDVIKICFDNVGAAPCCETIEFEVPDCLGSNTNCDINGLNVQTGDCTSDSTYLVTVNFQVANPLANTFTLWANGEVFGNFELSQLPLTIDNFPWNGGNHDVIKICFLSAAGAPLCCEIIEFEVPDCLGATPNCDITGLNVQTGDCSSDSTYHVTVNFQVSNPPSNSFGVWANGTFFGNYELSQLPLTIDNFPWNGGNHDVIKVCSSDANGAPGCCETIEFEVPDCLGATPNCDISGLNVQTGDCSSDSTYHVTVNFQVSNPPSNSFGVWANGTFFGNYELSQLPLTIDNFPWNGGNHDVIKVCFSDANGAPGCCETIEFEVPDCLGNNGNCDIFDLVADPGNCTGDSTYSLVFNFQVNNPPANTFGVWANGQFLGMFGLAQLPITIQNFPWNGGNHDVLKVCFTAASGTPTCCKEIEFEVPGCLGNNNDCEITNFVVDPGNCSSDSTYTLVVNFQVQNPLGNVFTLWANGVVFGTFNLTQLPLTIPNFPWDGGVKDVVKVCFVSANGSLGCCKTLEFEVPGCLGSGDCEIVGMVVDPGNCTSDSTYNLFINFQANNPPGNTFGIWANGVFQGSFNINQLPLNFPNFPWDGGDKDVVKVCFLDNAGSASCCKSLEFDVPNCVGGNGDCNISDVFAVRTPCLCGQFFVALTFQHDNGGAGGFDVVGNGNNYGTYPYNTAQPIILGPFTGDATTVYEFGVVDHEDGTCEDGFVLGTVTCVTAVVDPGSASSLTIAPNPASNWVNVTAMLQNGVDIGQAIVKIYHADGRLIQSQSVANAASFQLDVSHLPAGVYRMSIQGGAGRLEGSFTKQ